MWKEAKAALVKAFTPQVEQFSDGVVEFSEAFAKAKTVEEHAAAIKRIPKLADRDKFLEFLMTFIAGGIGSTTIRRLNVVEWVFDKLPTYVSILAWWDTATSKEISEECIQRFKAMRLICNEANDLEDGNVNNLFKAGGEIDIYRFKANAFYKFVTTSLKTMRTFADSVQSHWRDSLLKLTAELKGLNDIDWKGKGILKEPMKSELLTNPNYNNLSQAAKQLDAMIAGFIELHKDGCGPAIQLVDLDAAKTIKHAAGETVSITYGLYQATNNLPSITDENDRKEGAKSVLAQIDGKGYTLPDSLQKQLEMLRDTGATEQAA